MKVGLLVEGNDHLIVRTLLALLLEVDEQAIEADPLDQPGLGWQVVLEVAPKALKRFYGTCSVLAVVGVDNDGNCNGEEDPRHLRHWLHAPEHREHCRHCDLVAVVERVRPALHWIEGKPGTTWPVVICVPVEMIESWLHVALAIVRSGHGSLHAENEARAMQKAAFYGRPSATREDVENRALPLLRSLTQEHVRRLREHSRSFDQFAAQVVALKDHAGLAKACWR